MIAVRIPSPSSLLAMLGVAALLALPSAYADTQTSGNEAIRGSGVAKTETRNVTGFHYVALRVPASLKLRQGDSEGLTITSDDNIVPLVETVVENGTLIIRWADKHRYSTTYKAMEIVVNVKQIDGLAISGSGQIQAERLKAGNLRATIDGSGAMVFDALDANSVAAAVHGDGRLTAAGHADSLEVTLAGSGKLSAAKLGCRRATIAVMGSAEATVWAKEELTASIAGSGEINYYGTPRLSHTVAGSGSIRRAGDSS